MVRKTMKMLVVALMAAFALSSMAEAAVPPKRAVRHRAKHSSRVASGASTTPAKRLEPKKKKPTVAARSRTRAQASRSSRSPASTVKKAPATNAPVARRPTTKPH